MLQKQLRTARANGTALGFAKATPPDRSEHSHSFFLRQAEIDKDRILVARPDDAIDARRVPAAKALRGLKGFLPGPKRPDIPGCDRQSVERIRDQYRDLAPFGLWHPCALISREQFVADRDRMTDADHLAQFRRAMAFLIVACHRRSELNRRSTSYGLKHIAENVMRNAGVPGVYVSNGMFIAAALTLSFRVEQVAGTPNAWINAHPKRGAFR